jgi:hypothetical protein
MGARGDQSKQMATTLFAETLDNFQHSTLLIHEGGSYVYILVVNNKYADISKCKI